MSWTAFVAIIFAVLLIGAAIGEVLEYCVRESDKQIERIKMYKK